MKVLNCTRTDWANFSFDNSQALRSVGVDAESVCMYAHSFNYLSASVAYDSEIIKRKMREADIVQIIHSCAHSLNLFISSKSKAKLVVYHTGSIYRNNPDVFNKLFNPMVQKSVIALPEFSGLGSKGEQYIVGAVDDATGYVGPTASTPYIVAHYPSNPEVKGTDSIKEMMQKVGYGARLKFVSDIQNVSCSEQRDRVLNCDIYIELFKPELNGKPYGSFGIQALEAAAMGKIVVSQNMHKSVYEKEYGECKLILPEREEDFILDMKMLVNLSPDVICKMQEETRQWVVEKHGYKATGNRIVEKVLA